MKKFVSKRNRVWLEDGEVHKLLPDEEAAAREALFLAELREKSVRVPAVPRREGREIVLEYIDGLPLPDLLSARETDWDGVADALADWLERFYEAVNQPDSGEIRGDVNGRNFLLAGGRVFGVDFEAHCFGTREQDAGRLLAFVQTYDAPENRKKALLEGLEHSFSARMALDMDAVALEREKELAAMKQRRTDKADCSR